MADTFATEPDKMSTPSEKALAVTTHDTNPLTDIPKALYVGTGG